MSFANSPVLVSSKVLKKTFVRASLSQFPQNISTNYRQNIAFVIQICQPQEQKALGMRANEALVGTLMTIGAVNDKKCATEAFSINRQNRLVQLITDFQFQLYIPVRDTWVSVRLVSLLVSGPCHSTIGFVFFVFLLRFTKRTRQ